MVWMQRYQQKSKTCVTEITVEEIQIAITNAENNNNPGSDGLSREFYKEFADVLAHILLRYTFSSMCANTSANSL